jgi:Microcystin-dependent protein
MSESFIGEIRLWPCVTFTPQDWASCDGQILPIGQYQALYGVIGNHYGGTPNQTIGLPNLQGRTAASTGTGPGLTPRTWGQIWGEKEVIVTALPQHDHALSGTFSSAVADLTGTPTAGTCHVSRSVGQYDFAPETSGTQVNMAAAAITTSGEVKPAAHDNMQPYLALSYAICTNGVFPVPWD